MQEESLTATGRRTFVCLPVFIPTCFKHLYKVFEGCKNKFENTEKAGGHMAKVVVVLTLKSRFMQGRELVRYALTAVKTIDRFRPPVVGDQVVIEDLQLIVTRKESGKGRHRVWVRTLADYEIARIIGEPLVNLKNQRWYKSLTGRPRSFRSSKRWAIDVALTSQ